MATTRFPKVPNNMGPESAKWAREVEGLFNEILSRLYAAESTIKALGSKR